MALLPIPRQQGTELYVEGSNGFSNWSSVGIIRETEIFGLFVTAAIGSPTRHPRFLRLFVGEKEN